MSVFKCFSIYTCVLRLRYKVAAGREKKELKAKGCQKIQRKEPEPRVRNRRRPRRKEKVETRRRLKEREVKDNTGEK